MDARGLWGLEPPLTAAHELSYFLSCEGNQEAAVLSWFPVDRLVITVWSCKPQGRQVLLLWELWFLFLSCTSGCGWYVWGQNWERRNRKLHWIILLLCFQRYCETASLLLLYFAAEVTSLKHKYLYFDPEVNKFFFNSYMSCSSVIRNLVNFV